MWCLGQDRNQNEVGVIIEEGTSKDLVVICRKNDEIIRVKIVYIQDILIVVSAYASRVRIKQMEIEESIKRIFRRISMIWCNI